MGHKFESTDNYGVGGMDSDWCTWKYCPKCKTLKQIWRNGVSFFKDGKHYDKMPECKITDIQPQ